MAKKLEDMTPQERYQAKNYIPVQIRLHRVLDADILDYLDGKKRQTEIKRLIRSETNRQKNGNRA